MILRLTELLFRGRNGTTHLMVHSGWLNIVIPVAPTDVGSQTDRAEIEIRESNRNVRDLASGSQ